MNQQWILARTPSGGLPTDADFRLIETPIPEPATALLVGIYTDTGSFRHDNTTVDAFETAAWLVGRGADLLP